MQMVRMHFEESTRLNITAIGLKDKAAYELNADFPSNICSVSPAGKARDLELVQVSGVNIQLAVSYENDISRKLTK